MCTRKNVEKDLVDQQLGLLASLCLHLLDGFDLLGLGGSARVGGGEEVEESGGEGGQGRLG